MENLVETLDKDNFIPYCPKCMKEIIKRLYLKEQEDMEFIKLYKISPIQAAAWKFNKIRKY